MLIESQSGIRCLGLYRGLVLLHLPHGRLKVFVYGVYAEEYINQPDLLPICEQITPLWAGSFVGNGSFSYPNISSVVWVLFANEDVNYPIVIGATLGGENAYHLYELIKAQDEEISKKHMFTTGMAHFLMHESGKISSYVQLPYDNNVSIDFSLGDVSCEVSADIEDKIRNNEISHIICQNVIDNELNNGEISSSTHHFIKNDYLISTKIQLNNADNITIDTVCIDGDTSRDASSHININSTENVGIHDTIVDNKEKCSIINDRTAKNGKIEIKITDLDTGDFSRLYLDKTGNVFLQSTLSIVLSSSIVAIHAENLFDLKATSIKIESDVNTSIVSPAVNIDSSTGHTIIQSRTQTQSF